MTATSKAIYLGNTNDAYCGFTVGDKYNIHIFNTEDNYIGAYDDCAGYRHIKNGAFHKFRILEENGDIELKIQD